MESPFFVLAAVLCNMRVKFIPFISDGQNIVLV